MVKWENPSAEPATIQIELRNNMPLYLRELLEVSAPLGTCSMTTFREKFVNLATIHSSEMRSTSLTRSTQNPPQNALRQGQVPYRPGTRPMPYRNDRPANRPMGNDSAPKSNDASASRNQTAPRDRPAASGSGTRDSMCYNCRERGHFARDCPKPRRVQALDAGGEGELVHDHDADDHQHADDYSYQPDTIPDLPQDEPFDWADEMDQYFDDASPANDSAQVREIGNLEIVEDHADCREIASVEAVPLDAPPLDSAKDAVFVSPKQALQYVKQNRTYVVPSLLPDDVTAENVHALGRTRQVLALFEGKPVSVVLDTGAAVSAISKSFLEQVVPNFKERLLAVRFKALRGFGTVLKPLGVFPTTLIFPHPRSCIQISAAFLVLEEFGPTSILLGSDLIAMYGIDLVSSKSRYMRIGTYPAKFALHITRTPDNRLSTLDDVPSVLAVESEEFQSALDAAEFSPGLTEDQLHALRAMLCRNQAAFAYGARQLGEAKVKPMELEVDVPSPMPVRLRHPPYPASPRTKQDISNSIDELLALGIIRKSNSEFSAPVVMVYKGDKPRFCVNYKALNDFTRAFVYPLPRMSDTLAMLKEAKYLSVLDMNKGFHQCWVAESSRKYTAFASHRGLYEYVRMPFGLKNAPAHFQQAMDTILGDLLREGWVKVYIDDIIVFSRTFNEHLKHIERVLQAVAKNGFTISIKKCQFAFAELRALGRKVSGLDLAVDPHKVAAVEHWPRPTNIRTLQGFLGFINYHRAHIKDLAKITRSLSSLLSKDAVWEWTSEREEAFKLAKQALLSPAVLALPDWTLPFKLYIDACFDGLGAALTQMQLGKERPIAFISRKLKRSEERYAATQLECLGLVWSLEKLYYYLDGAHFEVYTDCQAIKSLMTVKNPNRHMLRWQLAIQEHRGHMTIIHRPGKDNQNADALSRNALPNDKENPACDLSDESPTIYAISLVELSDEWFRRIKEAYAKDTNVSRMIRALQLETEESQKAAETELPRKELKDFRLGLFFLMDGLLYKKVGPLSSVLVLADKQSKQEVLKHAMMRPSPVTLVSIRHSNAFANMCTGLKCIATSRRTVKPVRHVNTANARQDVRRDF